MSRQFDGYSPTRVGPPVDSAGQSDLIQQSWADGVLHQVLELAPDAMVIVNDHGQIALVNAQTEQLFGYDRHELLGQPVEILMPDRFRCRHREHLVDYFENPCRRAMGSDLEIYGLRKEGSEFPVEISLSPIETAGGVIVSIAIRDITDRKLTRAIDEARILAEAIVETVREPLLILDTELRVQKANRSFYQTFRATPQKTENQLVFELGNREWDMPPLRRLLEKVLPERTQFNDFQVQHTFEHIGQRTMLLNARALDREGERPGLLLLAIEDITDRKLTRAIDEARILAEAIVETVREPLLILDTELRVQKANRSFYQTFRATPQKTENQLVFELGNREWDMPPLRRLLEKVLPERTQFNDVEIQHSFEHIGQRTMLLNARALDREGERPGLLLLAIEDITDRKRAEDQVAHLSSVPEESPNPFVETDLAGNVTYLNPAAQSQLPDLVARAPQHPFVDGLKPLVAALEKTEMDSFVREVEVGDAIYEQKTHVSESNLIRIFANNITKRKRADKELKRSAAELLRYNRELERSNRELQDFAYVVSHDLRAPLVNLQGFSHELALSCERLPSVLAEVQVPEAKRRVLSALLEEDIPEALEFITTNTTKMDGLLSGVLRLSRVGQAALTIGPLNINQMLSEIVASRHFAIAQAGASLQVDSLPTCQGDEMQINQVFSNLLDNALKYLDPNRPGVIRVGGQEEPDRVVYSIEDNGIGISEEHRDSIYKVFHRLDPRRGTGEGLGLTIVRRILDRHRGKIWVESEVNEGSKFYLSLPKG